MRIYLTSLLFFALTISSSVGQARIALTYEPTKLDPVLKKLGSELEAPAKYVEMALPKVRNIKVSFQECGERNASYESGERRLVFCYELIAYLAKNALAVFPEAEQQAMGTDLAVEAFHRAMLFVFFHEVAHAYIDLADRRITGNEEDVADQVATFLMWDVGIDDVSLLGGFVFFEIDEHTELDVWDEHSPDARRLANLACWSYGAEPQNTDELFTTVGNALGDPDSMARRKERCGQEWSRIKKAWSKVVKTTKEAP